MKGLGHKRRVYVRNAACLCSVVATASFQSFWNVNIWKITLYCTFSAKTIKGVKYSVSCKNW